MKRRDFIKLSGGLIATAGSLGRISSASAAVCTVPGVSSAIALAITTERVELIDGQKVTVLAYKNLAESTAGRVPGPVLRAVEGTQVEISIFNDRPEAHGFEIGGIPSTRTTIQPGATCTVSFTAPVAGTYMYHDATHASRHLYRLLGLHGVFIVHPANGATAAGSITPYSLDKIDASAKQSISQLFDAFGTAHRFPGGKWVPASLGSEYARQEKIWLFSEIDPKFNALITSNGVGSGTIARNDAELVSKWVPRYFTINGRSGYDLSHEEDVVCKNYIGEPTLLRTLNAGLCHHATHIHGNHIFELAHSVLTNDGFIPVMGASKTAAAGVPIVHDNIWERDTWPTWPMQIRDMLLPYEAPPDIPDWEAKYVTEPTAAEEKFPLRYVMHDHCEMGTTAAGGNYPQGAVTHWEILGVRRPTT